MKSSLSGFKFDRYYVKTVYNARCGVKDKIKSSWRILFVIV